MQIEVPICVKWQVPKFAAEHPPYASGKTQAGEFIRYLRTSWLERGQKAHTNFRLLF